ncbi:MAG: EAL domain-containing protein [Curvibacter sp.]
MSLLPSGKGARSRKIELDQRAISELYEQQCSAEPIHQLGTVQPHGFMVVVDLATLRIVQVSSGIVRHWPGLGSPERLLHTPLSDWIEDAPLPLPSLLADLPQQGLSDLGLRLRDLRPAGEVPADGVAPWAAFECVGHRREGYGVLEWLPGGAAQADAAEQSRQIIQINRALSRIRQAGDLQHFFHECVRELQALSGYDRVMLYRFRPDWTGEVVAEHVAHGLAVRFLGMRFPAGDIPPQARALYERNTLRLLDDVDAVPDVLVPATLPDGQLLDQGHSLLRSMSPAHLVYLRNMGVRATLVVSLLKEGKLWGLLACHHQRPRVSPHNVRELLRSACELIANMVAMRIDGLTRIAHAEKAAAFSALLEQLSQSIGRQGSLMQGLQAQADEIMRLLDASDFGFQLEGLSWVASARHDVTRQRHILDGVSQLAQSVERGSARAIEDLGSPGRQGVEALPGAAGVLIARLPAGVQGYCFVTRPDLVRQVQWAGEPGSYDAVVKDGTIELQPRRSFSRWQQTMSGSCEPWIGVETDAIVRLAALMADAHKTLRNQALQRELEWRADHDHLTGLLNRVAAEQELARRTARTDVFVSLFLIDLDHFKRINDTLGHAAGDEVLQEISRRLGAVVRGNDVVARLGGDEFLLLTDLTEADKPRVALIAERLHRAMSHPFHVAGKRLHLRLSVGVAYSHQHGQDPGTLMRHADMALYAAKGEGRACTRVFQGAMEGQLSDAIQIEEQLRAAIGNRELRLHYQPKVDLRQGKVVGLEALVRWQHPARGLVGPDQFISLAERVNLIQSLGCWVVDEAARQLALWRRAGLPAWPVAVNVSFPQIVGGSLIDDVTRALRRESIPPEWLEIELTESVVMEDAQHTVRALQALAALGLKVSLDDFGTGYSSLAYVRQLPLDSLKIDRSFVQSVHTELQSQVITNGIIGLARGLRLSTIAEGVETEEQRLWLLENGCHLAQGYLFSKPVPADELPAVIASIERNAPG